MLRLLTLCVALLLVEPAGAAPKASDEILAAFHTRLETAAPFDDLIEVLDELELAELNKLQNDFDRVWPRLRDAYLAAFQNAAKEQNTGPARQANKKIVRQMREEFHTVRGMPEGSMKDALGARAWPAVQKLRELLLPSPDRILQIAGNDLKTQRDQLYKLGAFRDAILKAAIAIEVPETVTNVRDFEVKIAEEYSDLDRGGLRVMEKNRKIAESAMLPETERLGVEELNLIRLLVGLPALELDPKLCDASRDHSEDMSKMGFFSHTSPVPGKTTPADRARRAGTSGGTENIFNGSNDPKAANKSWFFSPGHHKNMFNPGHQRIGLGNSGNLWTQMFGG